MTSITTTTAGPPAGSPATDEGAHPAGESAEPQLLVFEAGGRRYGAVLESVREILVSRPLTRLPGAPPAVLGLLNVRGTLLTVLDLGAQLTGSPPHAGSAGEGHVLVVETDGRQGGCRVDVVRTVGRARAWHPAGPSGNADAQAVVMAIGELDGEPVAILDLPAIVRQTLLFTGER